MNPRRPWPVLFWVLLFSTMLVERAHATGRETRQGTVLVAGLPGGRPPVLYVAARLSTLVDFEGLLEPRAVLTPEVRERVGVVPVGPRSLVVVPVRDVAEGERLLLPVIGRTETGELRTLTLALVTRRDEVDLQAWVSLAARESRQVDFAEEGSVGAVARMILASHESDGRPDLALSLPQQEAEQVLARAGKVRARVDSVLRMNRHLFVTVAIWTDPFDPSHWRLVRVRMETRCETSRSAAETSLPVRITPAVVRGAWQHHVFSTLTPEGAGCVALTLEEDGPRTLRFEGVRIPP